MGRMRFGNLILAGAAVVWGCAEGVAPPTSTTLQPPREIRLGSAEMAIESVERDVSRAEVEETLQSMIARARMCLPWPSLWLEDNSRRNLFTVRFDLMTRDWGAEIAAESAQRMQEFVDLGLFTRRDRPDLGPGAATFMLTRSGWLTLSGSPYTGARPSFCLASERRLGEIVSMEWGTYQCGSLRVRFTHIAEQWPSWAATEAAQARVAATWAAVGVPMQGSVTLSRQWFRASQLPPGVSRNGALRSMCYDSAAARIVGDDLAMNAAGTQGEDNQGEILAEPDEAAASADLGPDAVN